MKSTKLKRYFMSRGTRLSNCLQCLSTLCTQLRWTVCAIAFWWKYWFLRLQKITLCIKDISYGLEDKINGAKRKFVRNIFLSSVLMLYSEQSSAAPATYKLLKNSKTSKTLTHINAIYQSNGCVYTYSKLKTQHWKTYCLWILHDQIFHEECNNILTTFCINIFVIC